MSVEEKKKLIGSAGQEELSIREQCELLQLHRSNYFGTFTPPCGVINDLDFLKALDFRDWLAGIAEAFKVAIIKDRLFLHDLVSMAARLRSRDEDAMERVVAVPNCTQSILLPAETLSSGDQAAPWISGTGVPTIWRY